MSLSNISDAIEPSIIPIKQIHAVSDSSAGYFFKVNGCKIKNPAQLQQLDISITVPINQFCSDGWPVVAEAWWLMAPPPFMI
uniref:Uncharacterized protein n=1 Tax=Medicago truncatula TaxID=3880 RepID=I3TAE7_MEDTR|nr:unknown [Medicago truncatula]